MKEVYTSAEARKTLQVDAKTFLRWLDSSDMQPQVSKADHRIKLFSRQQIEKLAAEHERVLPAEDAMPKHDSLEARIEALEHRMSKLESLVQHQKKSELLHKVLPQHARPSGQGTLPGDLVSYPQFARLHNIGVSTVQKAIETGRLQVVRGQWKQGQAIVQKALDAAGRAQFYELSSGCCRQSTIL